MKAWRIEYRLRKSAFPDKNFTSFWEELAKNPFENEDEKLKLLWESRVPGSGAPEHLIVGAIQAVENMGRNVRKAEKLLKNGFKAYYSGDFRLLSVITSEIFHFLNDAPKISGHQYHFFNRPLEWEKISEKFPEEKYEIRKSEIPDKICGGWYGQIAGASMGTMLEGYMHRALVNRFGKKLGRFVNKPDTYNDDITYEIAFLEALKEKGDISSEKIAMKWVRLIPSGWSAEQIALENLRNGIFPPRSGTERNYFQEWIGAAMRAMASGLVSPGNPRRAAYLAYLDGRISHSGNGLYGGIFVAALVSLSFVFKNPEKLLIKAIKYIPKGSELESVVWEVMSYCNGTENPDKVRRFVEKRFKTYNWIHLYPNIASVITAIYFSEGSFDRAMEIVASFGYDVDCNGGMAGTVLGVMNGEKEISDYWKEPFEGKIKTYLPEFEEIRIKDLCKTCEKFANGGIYDY